MAVIKAGNFFTPCRAVLFDKDGTLIDFKNMWLTWLNYMFNSLTAHYKLETRIIEDFEEAIGVNLEGCSIDPGGIMASGSMERVRESIACCLSCYGVDYNEARETFYNTVLASEREVDWASITHPVPGLERLLARLEASGIKAGVVTADNSRRAENALISLGLSSRFEAVVGADRVKETKPAPDMALLACELMQVEPEKTVVVGDNVTDMHMGREARAAGAVGVLTGVCGRQQLEGVADAVVESVAGIEIYAGPGRGAPVPGK